MSDSELSHDDAPIVAGVDGASATRSAIRYAAIEAARRQAPLRLVHVVTHALGGGLAYQPVDSGVLAARGHEILAGAAEIAHAAAPEVVTQTELRHGLRKPQLSAATVGAAMVVIGGAHGHGVEQVRTGTMAISLAKHATCPLVVVPHGWKTAHDRDDDDPVLVGYKSPDSSLSALATAFALADDEHRRLVILHAWRLPSGYDDVISARVSSEEIAQRAREAIESLIGDLRAAHPDVHVRIKVRHGQAARVLVDASGHAAALVLGRPPAGQLLPHLGTTDRAVLRHASCPIFFGRTSTVVTPTDLVLESDGRMQR